MTEVTRILSGLGPHDPNAAEKLLPLIYEELRKLAVQKLAVDKPGQTLQATALVHEAYLRLVDVEHPQQWEGRAHFFAAAAEAMRRILVEQARRRASQKRGGGACRVDLDQISLADDERGIDLLALNEALGELEQHDPQSATLVKLRFFGGLTHQEAAQTLQIGRRAADRLWAVARAWLYQRLGES